jgi:large subunit ribosomal protein L21
VYAVIRDQNRQAVVRAGDVILCDLKRALEPGAAITFDEVLLVGEEGSVRVGQPTLAGAKVTGEVLGIAKGEKLISLRFKRRKNVRVKRGHRQKFTRVRITGIEG